MLLIVGRDDTGDLEAQVRGSRHAWRVRIISIDALTKLVLLKERTDQSTVKKIHELFVPFEYTRLDRIIDIAFAVAEDTKSLLVEEDTDQVNEKDVQDVRKQIHTPRETLVELRERIATRLGTREGIPLVNKGSVMYWNPDANLRAVVSISKRYTHGRYWYAYHPRWHSFLKEGNKSFHVLGCLDRSEAYVIPLEWISNLLPSLHKTENESKMYWHILAEELPSGKIALQDLKNGRKEEISQFKMSI